MVTKRAISILTLLLFVFVSCTKQTPSQIEDSYTENIENDRLIACSKMNLFQNLFDHENQLAIFDCTQWSKKFPNMRKQVAKISSEKWNHLLMPLSSEALNDRQVLRQFIGITQKLDDEDGLEDLGKAITALSDTNFYDGMNALFRCAAGEECDREAKISKKHVTDSMQALNLVAVENQRIHKLLTPLIYNTVSLPDDFGKRFSKVLTSPQFKTSRVKFLDTLVSFMAKPKTDTDSRLVASLLNTSNLPLEKTIYGWVNSNAFNVELLQKLLAFRKNNPFVLDDLRSISAVRKMGLKCSQLSEKSFYVDLDHHLLIILNKLKSLEGAELTRYLEEDITLHQVASQSCPEFRSIKVNLTDKVHELSVVRLKKSLVDLIAVPGILPLVRILSQSVLEATEQSEREIGNLVSKYGEQDYLGVALSMLEIIEEKESSIISDYVNFLKAFKKESYNELAQLSTRAFDPEFRRSWPALGHVWSFFTETEKDFIFNYVDRHFNEQTSFKPLFNYYLNAYTVLLDRIPSIIKLLELDSKAELTFESLKDIASNLSGKEVLAEFSSFFSREHILKVIELFINGERLTQWAEQIRSILPANNPNRQTFTFRDEDSFISSKCLSNLASTDLDVLIKHFPTDCRPFDSQVTLKNLKLLSELGIQYKLDHGVELFSSGGLLDEQVMQSLIMVAKNIQMEIGGKDDLERLLVSARKNLGSKEFFEIATLLSQLILKDDSVSYVDFRSKALLQISAAITDKSLMENVGKLLRSIAAHKESGHWSELSQKQYPKEDRKLSCENDLNKSIGGTACPDKQELLDFTKKFIELLTKRNDTESPIAARLFLKALDSSAGVPIPLRARETHNQNLSIKESLSMFYDLSNRGFPYNVQDLNYIAQDSSSVQKTTAMERIEVVIRDVNFDENYLGAHYKNSVAKSYDYLSVVESKYKMFKICVKAGFCGKFMSRNEKRMAKNAVEAFPSLMDVQLHGLNYGDYMKALLGSVVASSSKVSQISTIVKFKKDGDGFNIPWIQTKRQLRKHNGKILSELAEISAFSNMARWTRDRFARTPENFDAFINSKSLNLISAQFLRGFDSAVSDDTLVSFLQALHPDHSSIVEDVIDFIDPLTYQELRKFEDIIGDILIISSSVCDAGQACNWNKLLQFMTWSANHYDELSKPWSTQSLKDVLFAIHPITDHIARNIVDENDSYLALIKVGYSYFNQLALSDDERIGLFSLALDSFKTKDIQVAADLLSALSQLMLKDHSSDADDSVALRAAASAIELGNAAGLADYIKRSAYTRACEPSGEIVVCKNNEHYHEPMKILKSVSATESTWQKYILAPIEDTATMSKWMSDSLDLITIHSPRD
tara:strand:+ start:9976 stop:14025 length:4050 start_codon:yes stop_codon:yes gene_type:complete